ncbi:polyprenyl synthetase family protein [bacterium]|nr:polyprenyl synthetase family protein [bacterium]
MSELTFLEAISAEKANIEKHLKFYLDSLHIPGVLHEAMNYSLSAGGKRLRPFLSIAVCNMLGKPKDLIMPYACALEFVHTFSLIHDDLPALDNDDLRRGRPSCHKAFREDIAILAGDALNTDAFSLLFEFGEGNIKRAGRYFAKAVGGRGMTLGQVYDCTIPENERTAEKLDFINYYKTSELFIAATAGAAAWLDASEKEVNALEEFASEAGIAFQISDDILDITSTTEKLGKPVGSDAALNKMTYPTLMGLDGARQAVAGRTEKAKAALSSAFDESEWMKIMLGFADYVRDMAK